MQPWVIRWRDKEWRSSDVRAQTLIAVGHEFGYDGQWQSADPWNGQVALASWLTVLFTSEIGDVEAARLMVHAMTADEFIAALQEPDDGGE